ncbi:MAG: hypothetical protein M3680_25810 [Myxococcota bacterium]|nr:hypothetical protein [Myxococcota bacterium]
MPIAPCDGPAPKAPGGGIIGGGGDAIGPCGAIIPGGIAPSPGFDGAASVVPQLRQNFMPGGFSPRHTPQMLGNPAGGGGVCPKPGASELPQFRQNDDPDGLSWPHIEQRI